MFYTGAWLMMMLGAPSLVIFVQTDIIIEQAMGYILVGSLSRLKTLVYKINEAEYMKVYI